MVIQQSKCGQLGNRLIIFSHFIANAIHYRYRLFNPTFDEYSRWFPATRNDSFGPYAVSVGGRGRLSCKTFERLTYAAMKIAPRSPWHTFIRWNGVRVFDLNDAAFLACARDRATLMFGWMFRDYRHVDAYQDLIRGFFTPNPEVLETVQRAADAGRRTCDVLVGVHVRRGDYRTKNSRFCFDGAVYRDQMEQTARLFGGGNRRVGFLVCSDEPVDGRDYPGLAVTPGPGGAVEDLYALSRCDYVMGPPSTFSLWAAFYGRVPRYWIRDPSQPIAPDAFTRAWEESV